MLDNAALECSDGSAFSDLGRTAIRPDGNDVVIQPKEFSDSASFLVQS